MKQIVKVVFALSFFICVSLLFHSIVVLSYRNREFKNVVPHGNVLLQQSAALSSHLEAETSKLFSGVLDKYADDAAVVAEASMNNYLKNMTDGNMNNMSFLDSTSVASGTFIKKFFKENMGSIRNSLSKTFKSLFFKYAQDMLPHIEDLIAKALQPPAVSVDVYNLLLRDILTSVANVLEKKACLQIGDGVFAFPRDASFDIKEHVTKIDCDPQPSIEAQ